jgi:hypothetical protein
MTQRSAFRYLAASPEVIGLTVMLYIRFPALAFPTRVVWFQSWGMTGLGDTAGVAGEAGPAGVIGHWTTSGAGGR